MAVLSGATASGRNLFNGVLTTTTTTNLYPAPAQSSNVTSPSATAYIKEIILCNITANPVTATLYVNGQNILYGLTINGNDTKILSGLNTMIMAGNTIQGGSNTASAVTCIISGVEIQ